MQPTFTAIDFETAQGYRWSICQVGLVRIVNGYVTAKMELLVQPPDNYYWKSFVSIHGIDWNTTRHAPTFDDVWPLIEGYISQQRVVAHNSAFDFACLKQTLNWYGIDEPEFEGHCTYRIFNKSLNKLCDQENIELDHHNALSDAMACATLFLKYLNSQTQ